MEVRYTIQIIPDSKYMYLGLEYDKRINEKPVLLPVHPFVHK